MRKIGTAFAFLISLVFWAAPVIAGTPADLRFERYWPALQQPWYFRDSAAFVGPDDHIYTADGFNGSIRKFSRDGRFVSLFDYPARLPKNISFDDQGRVLVASQGSPKITIYSLDGTFLNYLGSFGSGDDQFSVPMTIEYRPDLGLIVGDESRNYLHQLSIDGVYYPFSLLRD